MNDRLNTVDFFKPAVFFTFIFKQVQIITALNNNNLSITNINKLLTNHIIMK